MSQPFCDNFKDYSFTKSGQHGQQTVKAYETEVMRKLYFNEMAKGLNWGILRNLDDLITSGI